MHWNDAAIYDRFVARDRTLDGRVYVGVLTTGIYCRPSCGARKPKPENVRFFRTREDACAAGLRPCLRCRPERAGPEPDADLELFEGVQAVVRDDPAAIPDVEALNRAAGVGETKLRDLVRAHAHLSPIRFLLRERLRAAGLRLRQGTERVVDVAGACGFESLSAFHRQFLGAVGMTPGEYRDLGAGSQFVLRLPPDFRWAPVADFHGRDLAGPSERVRGDGLAKALPLGGHPAVLDIRLDDGRAIVAVRAEPMLGPDAMYQAHEAALRLLGLGTTDPAAFESRATRRPGFAELVTASPGLRIPLTGSVFESLVWAIVGQQVNLAFATALRREVIHLAGAPTADSMLAHPTAAAVARLDPAALTSRRFSRAKADYLIGAARAVAAGDLPAEDLPRMSAVRVAERLRALRGIGPWTAQYVMLRGCGFADCLPVGDAGLVAAVRRRFALDARPDPETLDRVLAPMAPYRSLAVVHLWNSLKENVP